MGADIKSGVCSKNHINWNDFKAIFRMEKGNAKTPPFYILLIFWLIACMCQNSTYIAAVRAMYLISKNIICIIFLFFSGSKKNSPIFRWTTIYCWNDTYGLGCFEFGFGFEFMCPRFTQRPWRLSFQIKKSGLSYEVLVWQQRYVDYEALSMLRIMWQPCSRCFVALFLRSATKSWPQLDRGGKGQSSMWLMTYISAINKCKSNV